MYKHGEKLKTWGVSGSSSSYQFLVGYSLKVLPYTLGRDNIRIRRGIRHRPRTTEAVQDEDSLLYANS